MGETLINEKTGPRRGASTLVLFGGVVVALLMAAAFTLAFQFAALPDTAGWLKRASLLRADAFVYGLASGLAGSILALCARSDSRRILGTGLVAYGAGFIVFGYVAANYMESRISNVTAPPISLVFPALLWFVSLELFVLAKRAARKPETQAGEPVNEERQQPLSQS